MADVETATNPEEGKIISKTVETKVEGDGTVVTEETTVIEINGDHKDVKDKEVISGETEKPPQENKNGEAVKENKPETGENQAENNGAAIETSGGEDQATTSEEQPKEQSPPKVILHQFPPSKDVPSPSVFCLKVETFLRLHKIPYENRYGAKPGKKGKLPWIEYQGDKIVDSEFIFDYLNDKFELNLDNELSEEQKALGQVITSTIQEKLYFALLYHRWVVNYAELKRIQRQQQSGIGFAISLKMQQNKISKYLDGQGMGRHSKDEVHKIVQKDIKAISTLLGEKDFLLGEDPSSYDCAVFGFFSQCVWNGLDEPLALAFMKENTENLIKYCERMKALCWHDWSDMILGDKPEPNLNKRFSFRKKKKSAKPKEEPAEEKKEEETEENKPESGEGEESKSTEETKTEEPPKSEETNNKTETKLEEVQNTEANNTTTNAEDATTNEE